MHLENEAANDFKRGCNQIAEKKKVQYSETDNLIITGKEKDVKMQKEAAVFQTLFLSGLKITHSVLALLAWGDDRKLCLYASIRLKSLGGSGNAGRSPTTA